MTLRQAFRVQNKLHNYTVILTGYDLEKWNEGKEITERDKERKEEKEKRERKEKRKRKEQTKRKKREIEKEKEGTKNKPHSRFLLVLIGKWKRRKKQPDSFFLFRPSSVCFL